MAQRKIVEIDESKCDGCGQCVPSCAEGAIHIVNGKAKLVSEVYCDGLGACLGHCPQDAIRIIEREAVDFDEAAAHRHVAQLRTAKAPVAHVGCPGSAPLSFRLNVLGGASPAAVKAAASPLPGASDSALTHWPVQMHLVPPSAPFLKEADLLLAADCVPFALADFHRRLLRGRPVLIGCPKLDDAQAYVDKLAAILVTASIRSLTVAHMEVPCCLGLMRIAQAAMQQAGRQVPVQQVVISRGGEVISPALSV